MTLLLPLASIGRGDTPPDRTPQKVAEKSAEKPAEIPQPATQPAAQAAPQSDPEPATRSSDAEHVSPRMPRSGVMGHAGAEGIGAGFGPNAISGNVGSHSGGYSGGYSGGHQALHQGPFGHASGDRRAEAPTPEEIHAAIEFFTTNSPNRMAYFDRLSDDAKRMVTNSLVRTYRPIQNFKDADPELYGLLVQQVNLRDQAFDLARKGDDGALHDKVSELVDVSLKTRKLRLDLLEKQIALQKDQLESDSADPSALVTAETSQIKNDGLLRWIERHPRVQSMLNDDAFSDALADAAPFPRTP